MCLLHRLVLIACLLPLACRSPPSTSPPPVVSGGGARVWVGALGGPGGDGSEARPFGSLARALERAPEPGRTLRIHLGPGRYAGPFTVPAGVELVGTGTSTVLYGHAAQPVLRAPTGVVLEQLAVEGGSWGLEGAGEVRLTGVRLSGQEAGGVRLGKGRLVVAGSVLEAGKAGAVGVALAEAEASAEVRASRFMGTFRRGVEARGAEVTLEEVRFLGAEVALHQAGGEVRVRRTEVSGGKGPGLFARKGTLRLEEVTVTGHEYGLQGLEATVEVRGYTSEQAQRAGVALVGGRGDLEGVVVRGSGSFGGLQLLGADVVVRGVRVEDADAYGIAATRGRLRVEGGILTRLTTREGQSGDGLHLRDVEAEVEGLVVRDVAGLGVLGAQGARVVLREVSLEGCRQGGVVAETLGEVKVESLEVQGLGGPVLAAHADGVLRVEELTLKGAAWPLVWADCQGATRVRLGRVRGTDGGWGELAPCVSSP